eukprot:jgi/Psemu1/322504/estExt_fgenesh1_pg.C_300062
MGSPSDSSSGDSTVNLLDLGAAALASAIVAADQITALASSKNNDNSNDNDNDNTQNSTGKKNARLKIDGSFVTDADMAAQQIIVDALCNKVSSGIRIVGEENEEEMRKRAITGHEERLETIFQLARKELLIRYKYHGVDPQRNPELLLPDLESPRLPLAQCLTEEPNEEPTTTTTATTEKQKQRIENDTVSTPVAKMDEYEIETSRISVWIDPLDATNSYAKGDYDPVSILVAIIVDQTPCFGVICKPFGYSGQPLVLDTGCMAVYGGTLLGAAYIAGSKNRIQHNNNNNNNNKTRDHVVETEMEIENRPRTVISKSRSDSIRKFVSHLAEKGIVHPEPLLVSGAGEKSLRIITRFENEGLWFFPTGGTSLWDVAASDALLRATGGRLTDKYGNDLDYSKSRNEAENENGVVACYDRDLHAECIRLYLEVNGMQGIELN